MGHSDQVAHMSILERYIRVRLKALNGISIQAHRIHSLTLSWLKSRWRSLKAGPAGVPVGHVFKPAASLGSWRGSAAGSSGSPPQVFQEPGTPAEGHICSKASVCLCMDPGETPVQSAS